MFYVGFDIRFNYKYVLILDFTFYKKIFSEFEHVISKSITITLFIKIFFLGELHIDEIRQMQNLIR